MITENRIVLILLIWGLVLAAPEPQAKSDPVARHALYGFEIPYPKELTSDLPAGLIPFIADKRMVPVTLMIDAKGSVTEVRADDPSDSILVHYYRDNLKRINFEPARVDGKKSALLLPLILQFEPNRKLPYLYLPVDSNLTISDLDLYLKTFEINEVTLPSLETFPSYFCDLEWSDSLTLLPYILLSLKLDVEGELTEVEIVSTNYQTFALQLKSATLSAEFKPLYVNGQPRASSCFLLISFFSPLTYPTEIWKRSSLADYSILQRSQIRLLPDTVGLLTKPLPQFFPPNTVTVAGKHISFSDTVIAAVMINREGELSVFRYGKVAPQVRQGIKKLSKAINFFPAMDYSGKPRDFYGLARFIFSNSATIRIEYLW